MVTGRIREKAMQFVSKTRVCRLTRGITYLDPIKLTVGMVFDIKVRESKR